VFEEQLVNALVHCDYLVSAPIRLFIFDDRIEIISPGHLPNNMTVEKILSGNSNIRNPILVSYVAKGLLPYHGLGSGIKRALDAWPQINFIDDRDGCLFTATIRRKPVGELTLVVRPPKTSGKIMAVLKQAGHLTIPDIASLIGIKNEERKGFVEISDEDLDFKQSELKKEHSKLSRRQKARGWPLASGANPLCILAGFYFYVKLPACPHVLQNMTAHIQNS